MNNPVRNAILGLVTGDALGVPVEFRDRESLKESPVTGMTGYGTYNQPPGTWSDDSSLTLCTAEALAEGFNLQRIADRFVSWLYHNEWTPHGEVFDVGITTSEAISRLKAGEKPHLAGAQDENSNGNGSLMRILPLLFYLRKINSKAERYEIISKVSGLTHGHIRSVLACFYYLEFAGFLMEGKEPYHAYKKANESFLSLTESLEINSFETDTFSRLTGGSIHEASEDEIHSDGYVIHTLEASIWCLLTTPNYPEAVLKAVNLGNDTDTTGAVTGGLAGLMYSADSISREWLNMIARLNDIEAVIENLNRKYG
ncbi:MAG: ADP-ribosylglycohydrolase family protein [Bacteroidales bacterium]